MPQSELRAIRHPLPFGSSGAHLGRTSRADIPGGHLGRACGVVFGVDAVAEQLMSPSLISSSQHSPLIIPSLQRIGALAAYHFASPGAAAAPRFTVLHDAQAPLPKDKIKAVLEGQILPRFTNCFMQLQARVLAHRPHIARPRHQTSKTHSINAPHTPICTP